MGWLRYHTYDSRRSRAGFPDLVLVRPPRLLFIELKTARGKTSEDQREWAKVLKLIPGVEYYLWRPADEAYIRELLNRGRGDKSWRYWLRGDK